MSALLNTTATCRPIEGEGSKSMHCSGASLFFFVKGKKVGRYRGPIVDENTMALINMVGGGGCEKLFCIGFQNSSQRPWQPGIEQRGKGE